MVRYTVYQAFCECLCMWLPYTVLGQLFHVVLPLVCSQVRVSVCNQYWVANTKEPPKEREGVKAHSLTLVNTSQSTGQQQLSCQCAGMDVAAKNLKLINGIYIENQMDAD